MPRGQYAAQTLVQRGLARSWSLERIGHADLAAWVGSAEPQVFETLLDGSGGGRSALAARLWEAWQAGGVVERERDDRPWRFSKGGQAGIVAARLRRVAGREPARARARSRGLERRRARGAAVHRRGGRPRARKRARRARRLPRRRPGRGRARRGSRSDHDRERAGHAAPVAVPLRLRPRPADAAALVDRSRGGGAQRAARGRARRGLRRGQRRRLRHGRAALRCRWQRGAGRALLGAGRGSASTTTSSSGARHGCCRAPAPVTPLERQVAAELLVAAARLHYPQGPFTDGLAYAQAALRHALRGQRQPRLGVLLLGLVPGQPAAVRRGAPGASRGALAMASRRQRRRRSPTRRTSSRPSTSTRATTRRRNDASRTCSRSGVGSETSRASQRCARCSPSCIVVDGDDELARERASSASSSSSGNSGTDAAGRDAGPAGRARPREREAGRRASPVPGRCWTSARQAGDANGQALALDGLGSVDWAQATPRRRATGIQEALRLIDGDPPFQMHVHQLVGDRSRRRSATPRTAWRTSSRR